MSGRTWAATNVPTMWISAQAADTEMAWEQVGAWARMQDLLLYHGSRLRKLQLDLAAAWPPSQSPAATAFVQHLDVLLSRISQAGQDAGENCIALQHLLESLGSAKRDMAPLKEKWDRYESEASSRSQNLVNDLPHSGGTGWQEDLNAQARARMTRSDQEIFEAYQMMVVPYGSSPDRNRNEPFGGSSAGGAPPEDDRNSASMAELSPTRTSGLPDSLPVGAAPSAELAGSGLPSAPSGAVAPSVGTAAQLSPPPVTTIPWTSGGIDGPKRLESGRPSRTIGGSSVARLPVAPAANASAPMNHSGRVAGARVNPVGGVISTASTGGMPVVPIGRAGATAQTDRYAEAVTPMLQWEVATGGPSVIEPPAEHPFVLGPGVIGIDR